MEVKVKPYEYLDIALRCHVEPEPPKRKKKKDKAPREKLNPPPWLRPEMLLILDCETATDLTRTMPGFEGPEWSPYAQSLLFGTARLYVLEQKGWRWTDEWLFYPDDLPEFGLAALRGWVDDHTERVGDSTFMRGTPTKFHFCPLSTFLKNSYWIAHEGRALVCGFNLPFDLSRLAWNAVPAGGRFEGGFRLDLFSYVKRGVRKRDPYRPDIRIKNLGSRKASIEFTGIMPDDSPA